MNTINMEAGAQDLEVSDMTSRFEKFFRTYYHKEILRVAHGYPEEKSLIVNFDDLDKYDITLAEELIRNPDATILAAEKALKNIDLPIEAPSINIHVHFENLPATYRLLIRDIRSEDVGRFMAVEGIVRKSTDVRPKLVMGAFECERCGSVMHISQDGNKLKEPFLCESCERRGPFKLLVQESTFVDAQKILIQESLEDLRGGEHPKQLSIFFEDDLTGKIMPGDRIEIAGTLRAVRKRFKERQSRVFEIFFEANSLRHIEIDFEEVQVTKEDEKKILELSKDPLIYEKIRDSIAPHIYGYADIKEAIMYQLFSSPALELPDGGRIRGDSHIIIMGEPATGKCIVGDSKIQLDNGSVIEIRELADPIFKKEKPFETADGRQYIALNDRVRVLSMNDSLKIQKEKVTHLWRRRYSGKLLTVSTFNGAKIKATPEHPFFVTSGGKIISTPASELRIGESIAVPRILPVEGTSQKLSANVTRSVSKNAIHITIPKETSPELMRLLGYLIAEGSLNNASNGYSRAVRLSNMDSELIKDFVAISEKLFGIKAKRYEREVQLTSAEVTDFVEKLGRSILLESSRRELPEFVFKCTNNEVANLLRAFFDGEGYVNNKQSAIEVSSASLKLLEQVRYMLLRFGITSTLKPVWKRATNSNNSAKKKYFRLVVYGLENLTRFFKNIGFLSKEKMQRLRSWTVTKSTHTNSDVIPNIGGLLRVTRRASGLTKGNLGLATAASFRRYEIGKRNPSRAKLGEYCRILSSPLLADGGTSEMYQDNLKNLYLISKSDIFWDRVVNIEEEYLADEHVYDLTVEHSHNFIANGIIIHNSEILQYVAKELAPRGIYASGKGTSAAGLTAAAIKDEFGDGGWTLEAGALVLADKGVACIDEFDKMEVEDRGAMHEAMEQQSVSIAKAGMLATFRARCSILAAANPKYGRFDEYRAISEQVNLSPTILSRFDLIFFVRDIVEETREVAKHILDTVVSPTSITPKIEPELLRKYIAYARQNVLPVLTEDARNRIEQFYVEMREVAREAEDVPIPMTARQLWAIIRIARAASRVRLSNETTVEDVERAIKLVKVSLKQAGVDMETGRVDIDKIMVGVTKSQRDRLTHVLDIIKELEKEYGTAKKSEILEKAMSEGIPEKEAEKAIEKLRLDGHIFEPKFEHYKTA